MLYFDHNATSPMHPEARRAWLDATSDYWLNPASPYRQAAAVKVRLESARSRLADILGCCKGQVVFNSGATEGNNTVLSYFNEICPTNEKILVSPLEHPSVLESARRYLGEKMEFLTLERGGVVDMTALEVRLSSGEIFAVSLMAANNETGILQPWEAVRDACSSNGIYYHCDAAQWLGKLSAHGLGGCDFVTGCAHKFGGPMGCGFLKLSPRVENFSFMLGGIQEMGHRPGTENFPSVSSMLAALDVCKFADQGPRDAFELRIIQEIPGTLIVGHDVARLWNTSTLILPEFLNTRWVNRLSSCECLVSTGAACATAKEGPSHVLTAMGISPEDASRAVRVSGCSSHKESEWLTLADVFINVFEEMSAEKDRLPIGGSKIIDV
ncbi:MAG: aminotransferase class V-fold PLP-dependent enzyme [Opitutae bacterium]|nr:aminotransferase class V-fold PLP-dependent enzyme [Opitutae bacterium]